MRARVVCDSSAVVALLLELEHGPRVAEALDGVALLAPALVLFEVTNVLRRQALRGAVSGEEARRAHLDLLALRIELWPYPELAARCWELRDNLTIYDASYVAVAELAGATLVTLDVRLAGAPGLRCPILTP